MWKLNSVMKTGSLAALVSLAFASAPMAQETMKVGVVGFLTGGASGPFGIPAQNAAELIIDAINNGDLPGAYATPGIGGLQVEPIYVDEAGGSTTQVTELRRLVQQQQVDAVVGYISSGSCLAVAPVAEELEVLTVLFDCGTPRIFEEASYRYVFRTAPHATMDNVGAALYAAGAMDGVNNYAGLNQNYAWGQDSWRDFSLVMQHLNPNANITKELFPKIFAGEYGAEISALLISRSDVLHSSFWGGDLESFIFQATARGLPLRLPMILTTGETVTFRLADKLPDGTIVGARGPHGVLANESELNTWFRAAYQERFGEAPTYPSYHMAQGFLGLKSAADAAAADVGGTPNTEEIIAAFEGLEFEAVGSTVKMALAGGHQAISETAYGTFRYNTDTGMPEIVDVVRYSAECVNPPEGQTSVEWLEAGMPGAICN